MDIGQALSTAIEYEKRVAAAYGEALSVARDEAAARVFSLLRNEELGHVDYLEFKLASWRSSGGLGAAEIGTAVPEEARLREGAARLEAIGRGAASDVELGALKRASALEQETSAFYRRVSQELDGEGRAFFRRFAEIEDGHLALVSAELGALEGTGHWFDMPEFDLESA